MGRLFLRLLCWPFLLLLAASQQNILWIEDKIRGPRSKKGSPLMGLIEGMPQSRWERVGCRRKPRPEDSDASPAPTFHDSA
jgi:hypothetical protein